MPGPAASIRSPRIVLDHVRASYAIMIVGSLLLPDTRVASRGLSGRLQVAVEQSDMDKCRIGRVRPQVQRVKSHIVGDLFVGR